LLAGALRALPAGLLLLAVSRVLPSGSWWWRALVLGTLNIGAFLALLYVAAYRLPGGVAATIIALQPLVVAVLAVALLGESLPRRRLLAGIAGVLGVALLVLDSKAALDPLGVAAGLGAAGCMSLGVVLTQRWARPDGVSLLAFAGWQLTAGGLVLAPLVLIIEGVPATLSASNLGGFAYLSLIGAALTYPLWFRGISQLSAPVVSFLVLLSPVVAALLGAAVLAQTFTAWQTLGFIIVLASVFAGQLPPRGHANARNRTASAASSSAASPSGSPTRHADAPGHGSTPRPPRTPRRRI
jgi:probable blue pigment (indigoidine) exporter